MWGCAFPSHTHHLSLLLAVFTFDLLTVPVLPATLAGIEGLRGAVRAPSHTHHLTSLLVVLAFDILLRLLQASRACAGPCVPQVIHITSHHCLSFLHLIYSCDSCRHRGPARAVRAQVRQRGHLALAHEVQPAPALAVPRLGEQLITGIQEEQKIPCSVRAHTMNRVCECELSCVCHGP